MPIPFAAVVTPQSLVFTDPTGKTHTVAESHAQYPQIKALVRQIGALNGIGDTVVLMEQLLSLVSPAQTIALRGEGKVTVADGVVYYGQNPIRSVLTERILWGMSEGFSMQPYIAFLENMMQNPSKRAVDELFTFVEKHKMGITEDGHILAYKRVRDDFRDIYSGKIDNSPGQIPWMPRNAVNDDPRQTCSDGLHACAQSYLSSYGSGPGNRIVIVKINPADVVSVPIDYDAAKMRCCRYEVLGEYQGADKDDLLAARPVFESDDFRPSRAQEEYDEVAIEDQEDDGDFAHEFADDDADDNVTEYDRGYDAGYAKGVFDADDVTERNRFTGMVASGVVAYESEQIHSEDDYSNGFLAGWCDAMRHNPAVEPSEPVVAMVEPIIPEPDVKPLHAAPEPKVAPLTLRYDPNSGGFRPV